MRVLPKPTNDELGEISTLFKHIGPDNALTQYLERTKAFLADSMDITQGEETHKLQGARCAVRELAGII